MKNIGLLLLLISCNSFAQDKVVTTLISKDSLSYVTLFNNDFASYFKYSGYSPIIISQARIKGSNLHRCGTTYICAESGYGKYKIKDNILSFKFENVKKDSISIEYLETQKDSKVISVIFSPVIELDRSSDFPIMMVIESEEGNIPIDNYATESKEIRIELLETALPKAFVINGSQRVLIYKFQNQKILYLVNHHKEMITLTTGERKFNLSEMFEEK